jgi:hypothetical protein
MSKGGVFDFILIIFFPPNFFMNAGSNWRTGGRIFLRTRISLSYEREGVPGILARTGSLIQNALISPLFLSSNLYFITTFAILFFFYFSLVSHVFSVLVLLPSFITPDFVHFPLPFSFLSLLAVSRSIY